MFWQIAILFIQIHFCCRHLSPLKASIFSNFLSQSWKNSGILRSQIICSTLCRTCLELHIPHAITSPSPCWQTVFSLGSWPDIVHHTVNGTRHKSFLYLDPHSTAWIWCPVFKMSDLFPPSLHLLNGHVKDSGYVFTTERYLLTLDSFFVNINKSPFF